MRRRWVAELQVEQPRFLTNYSSVESACFSNVAPNNQDNCSQIRNGRASAFEM